MVNVIDNGARNRTNMMPVGIKIVDDKGNVAYTAKTDLGTNYISLESKWFDSSSNNTGGSTGGDGGGNTGGGTNHPAAGADYYAGSLADGEITQRKLEWSGIDDPTKDTIVTFNDDPGLKPFGQYTGLTILGHIQKTVMTAGTKGAVSTLDLNYDPTNVAKDGYFTTTASYPNYVKSEGLVVGKSLSIPMNGVGENLKGNNIKSPEIQLTYNADKTLTIKHIQGYVNDGNTSGATGANYDYIVDAIATFSTQSAVAQLPPSVNLFTGSTNEDVALSGISNFYENSMDGIEITFDDYVYSDLNDSRSSIRTAVNYSKIASSKVVRIPKEWLIINGAFNVSFVGLSSIAKSITDPHFSGLTGGGQVSSDWSDNGTAYYFGGIKNGMFSIKNMSLETNLKVSIGQSAVNANTLEFNDWYWNIVKVTPYRK